MTSTKLLLVVGCLLWAPTACAKELKGFPGRDPKTIYDAHFAPREVQIIDDRPVVRDFREAPKQPDPIKLPPPTNEAPLKPADATDPDSSPEMKLAWDDFHKRVAEEVYMRFCKLVGASFNDKGKLLTGASYTVTSDGRILDAKIVKIDAHKIGINTSQQVQASYNAIVLKAINSMSGDPILKFPQGARKTIVQKQGTFTWNFSPPYHQPLTDSCR